MDFARLALVSTLCLLPISVAASDPDFAKAMDDAMARMHADMAMRYSGNPDRDFARMMIPHHQGAIDMAKIELQHGTDERLRRLAQGIIVEQQQEILTMQLILGPDEPATPAEMQHMPHGDHR